MGRLLDIISKAVSRVPVLVMSAKSPTSCSTSLVLLSSHAAQDSVLWMGLGGMGLSGSYSHIGGKIIG